MNTTTTLDLMLYLFNETDLTETVKVQNEIDSNYLVHEHFEELKDAFLMFDDIAVTPSANCLNSIKAYSAMTSAFQRTN